ncbi:MAG: SapC family protein [Aliiglaciecola sp.]
MPNHQVLDNVTHKDLKIITDMLPRLGDDVSYANIFVSEFRQVQGVYPIFFRKNSESGKFEAIAMFGFAEMENLYLTEKGWQGDYVPLSIQRRPFLIGFQNTQVDGVLTQEPVVFVDMDSPRVSEEIGEPVFLEQGGQSDYLQHMTSVLKAVNEGHQLTDEFVAELLSQDLIESVSIKVTLKDGSNNELTGIYTINEEKVAALSGEDLQNLHSKGYLQMIHMIEASMANLSPLIEKKNATL